MIPKVDDTGSHLLIRSTLLSSAAATAATDGDGTAVTGVLNGTASASDFDSSLGFSPTNGGVSYTNFANNGHLANAGQVVMDFTTTKVADADEAATASGSRGDARASGSVYLMTFEDSGGVDKGYVLIDATNSIRATPDGTLAYVTAKIHTRVHEDYVRICFWWKGTRWGVMADGIPIIEETSRAIFAANYYKLIVGTSFNGTTAPFNGRIKNLVVSSKPPRMGTKQLVNSIGVFGDSFATGMTTVDTIPTYDGTTKAGIESYLYNKDIDVRRWIADGNSGFTVCDTGGNNLSAEIAGFIANNPTMAIIAAGNNDPTAGTQAQIDDGTNGTDAHYKEFIQQIMFNDYPTADPGIERSMCERVFITTARSLKQDATLDTEANAVKRDSVNVIINALPAWWDATYPSYTGRVHIIDLYSLLGDYDDNENYQGYWTTVGNIAQGGSASPAAANNAHPSAIGYKLIGDEIAKKIKKLL